MTDLDQMLDAVRTMPTDVRLEQLDDAVLRGVAVRRDRIAARRSLALAGLLAIGVGWAGSIVPAAPAQASPVSIGMSDYAPSRLLGQ
ncbi:hypothetical protein M9978_13795 [Sphingomonas sp. MG17]|uniref:Uncharacterized protein n=1 Tax=Sphingomonas tagetis TaxID=2949092 RepID=A0A9X2HKT2_9SPHN|nr:hypothetical protein [Sphingomonas tagetis]MCP3731497.1 hypothetical protein [Sphingomonas tagetis]